MPRESGGISRVRGPIDRGFGRMLTARGLSSGCSCRSASSRVERIARALYASRVAHLGGFRCETIDRNSDPSSTIVATAVCGSAAQVAPPVALPLPRGWRAPARRGRRELGGEAKPGEARVRDVEAPGPVRVEHRLGFASPGPGWHDRTLRILAGAAGPASSCCSPRSRTPPRSLGPRRHSSCSLIES